MVVRPVLQTVRMDQDAFDEMLGLEELPLCSICRYLLREWAESDARFGRSEEAWHAFEVHRAACLEGTAQSICIEQHVAGYSRGNFFPLKG